MKFLNMFIGIRHYDPMHYGLYKIIVSANDATLWFERNVYI